MSKQVLSVEQMEHLHELGLRTNLYGSTLLWWKQKGGWELYATKSCEAHPECDTLLPAYTLQDVLDALPRFVTYQYRSYDLIINMEQFTMEYFREADLYTLVKVEFINTSLIDAAYEMLCWCIKEGYVKTKN